MRKQAMSVEMHLDAAAALARIKKLSLEAGLHISLKKKKGPLEATECTVRNLSGQTAAAMSSGREAVAEYTAIAEAVCRLVMQHESVASGLETFNVANLAKSLLANGSPWFERLLGQKEITLSCVQCTPLTYTGKTVSYPAVLLNPHYEATTEREALSINLLHLRRYSSSAGTALGMNEPHALLIGMLDLLAADAVSLALLESAISPSPKAVKIIQQSSLPQNLRLLCSKIKHKCHNLKLVNITTSLGIPAILTFAQQRSTAKVFASASSLFVETAIEKALNNLLSNITKKHYQGEAAARSAHYERSFVSSYARCHFDEGFFDYQGGEQNESYEQILTSLPYLLPTPGHAHRQLQLALAILNNHGIEVYSRRLSVAEQALPLYQVISPQLERFHLVTNGHFIAPGARGHKHLEKLEVHK